MSNTKDWTKPNDNDEIDVPDELMPLFNQIGTQIRFHTISGKNEVLTVAHCVRNAEQFFQSRISELEAENKRLREALIDAKEDAAALIEQHRWIPVTERLPETSGDCAEQVIGLSSAPGTEVPYVVICVAFYDGHFYVLDTFSEIDFSEPLDVVEHQIKTITHWQPLPQPPKEQ